MLFVVLFFGAWFFMGLLAWAVLAVLRRGRGALVALPLGLLAAAAAGVLVPLTGLRDATGLLLSLLAAVIGGALGTAAGMAFSERLKLLDSRPRVVDRPPRE
jgi:uncharacterized membrane protein YeaQ/YmgE (transglycosylase-associated protein family)